MTPAQARFVEDFRQHVGDRLLKEVAGMAAYRIVTADDDNADWETFHSSVKDLQREASRLGALYLPDPERGGFLDEAIPRALLFWIADWSKKWSDQQAIAAKVAIDIDAWNRRVREWSSACGFVEP